MKKFKGKEYINTLLDIENLLGSTEKKVLPVILTIAVAAIPLVIWLLWLRSIVHYIIFIIFELLWTGRFALKFIGNEPEKMEFYDTQRADEYRSADELVHVTRLQQDGLIEYTNGRVVYLISALPKSYLSDDALSVAVERFMDELDEFDWDFHMYNATDEILCEDLLPNLKAYKDKEVIADRINFYSYQDDYTRNNSALYRYVFVVSAMSTKWKRLKTRLQEIMESEVVKCFNEIQLCEYGEVGELFNRDVCTYIDVNKMLEKKFDNDEFYESKVLWYDENVPTELLKKDETSNLEERRVTSDTEG